LHPIELKEQIFGEQYYGFHLIYQKWRLQFLFESQNWGQGLGITVEIGCDPIFKHKIMAVSKTS
jgi:hypothetical protein